MKTSDPARKTRRFSATLATCILLALPALSWAAPKSVGVLLTARVPYYRAIHKAMLERLKEIEIREGRDVTFLVQRPLPDEMAWRNAVRKLLVYDVDVLVTYGDGAARSALAESDSVPVVFGAVNDPEPLRGPGRPSTGVRCRVTEMVAVENLHRLGSVNTLGIIFSHDEPSSGRQAREIARREHAGGFQAFLLDVNDPGIWHRFEDMDAILVTPSSKALSRIDRIVARSERFHLPTAALAGNVIEEGIMFSVASDAVEQGSLVADRLKDVLAGRAPERLPVLESVRTTMEINVREARENKLTVPFDMILSATRMIR